ncbi:MAG TPA: VOC family protein [Gemmatimonadales bacterium]|nr:VOC family protein [Gemmatimonadales bacterium]
MTPPLTGILETALYVADLERAERFYGDLFGFGRLFRDERLSALDVAGKSVLLLFRAGASEPAPIPVPGGTVPPHGAEGRIHLAFAIPAEALAGWEARLEARGIPIEGRVAAPRGGHSLYFRDPDGHLLELATPGLWPTY